MNCLLKAVAICVFDILSLLLKLMVLFGCALGELSASVFIVFHSVCLMVPFLVEFFFPSVQFML